MRTRVQERLKSIVVYCDCGHDHIIMTGRKRISNQEALRIASTAVVWCKYRQCEARPVAVMRIINAE